MVAVEAGGLRQERDTSRDVRLYVPAGKPRFELTNVEPEFTVAAIQANLAMLCGEPAFPQRFLNLPKDLPQILERAGLAGLGPEQRAEGLTRVFTWLNGKISQQSQSFA